MTGTPSLSPEAQALETVAELMCLAARTAPKARELDNLYITLVHGEDKAARGRPHAPNRLRE